MADDDLVYHDALEDLGDGYESYPESEEDAEDPEEVSVVHAYKLSRLLARQAALLVARPFLLTAALDAFLALAG